MSNLSISNKGDYTIVRMQRGKVNAINAELVNELRTTFADLSADEATKGVILTGQENVFSAGLDLIELYQYKEKEISDFLTSFGMLHCEMSRFPKPFISAITGHSPAGGTVLAITSDYRVMVDNPKFLFGLNEMKVNVQINHNLIAAYNFWLGTSLANRFILEGKLLNSQDALRHHLVDEICPADEVLDRAEVKMKEYLSADPDIFKNTKSKIRAAWHASQNLEAESELEEALKIWWKPEIRKKIEMLILSFKNKK